MSVDISSATGRHTREVLTEPFRVETPHGNVHGIRFIPPADRCLNEQLDVHPVVFSQGWAESPDTTKWFGQAMAKSGLLATMFDYPAIKYRGILPHEVQELRYEVFESVLDATEGEKGILAHSEGTYVGLTAAAERNDITATLLTAPAGLGGKFTPWELVKGGCKEGVDVMYGERNNILGARALAGAVWSLTKHVGGRPGMSVVEVNSIAMTDARPHLVRALGRGARIGMQVCEYDRIFPRPRVEIHLGGLIEEMDLYEILMMNHVDFLRKSEESGLVTNAMQKLLDKASQPKITAS